MSSASPCRAILFSLLFFAQLIDGTHRAEHHFGRDLVRCNGCIASRCVCCPRWLWLLLCRWHRCRRRRRQRMWYFCTWWIAFGIGFLSVSVCVWRVVVVHITATVPALIRHCTDWNWTLYFCVVGGVFLCSLQASIDLNYASNKSSLFALIFSRKQLQWTKIWVKTAHIHMHQKWHQSYYLYQNHSTVLFRYCCSPVFAKRRMLKV